MKIINDIKDINSLYQSDLIYKDDGTIRCPVCDKEYKREKAAIAHYKKQDCFDVVYIFGGSSYESYAYEMYKSALAKTRSRVSLKIFRKSPSYRVAIQFILICIMYEIPDYGEYYSFLKEIKRYRMNKIFSYGQRQSHIEEYRFFRHEYGLIASTAFFTKWKDELLNDDMFLLESIEKAHIGISFVENNALLVDVIEKMPYGMKHRLHEYITTGDI
jgi:hypothetical protein